MATFRSSEVFDVLMVETATPRVKETPQAVGCAQPERIRAYGRKKEVDGGSMELMSCGRSGLQGIAKELAPSRMSRKKVPFLRR